MRHALVKPDNTIDRFATDVDPNVPTRAGYRWLPCPTGERPTFDATTQALSGPIYTVGQDTVVESWSVRARSAEELVLAKQSEAAALSKVAFLVLLNHENRLRALEGKQAVTAAQFRNALEVML